MKRRTYVLAIGTGIVGGFGGCSGDSAGEDDGDVTLAVETVESSDVASGSATLTGEITAMDGLEDVTARFEYGQAEEDLDSTVDAGKRSAPGTFEATVNDLDGDTAYEFRALAEAGEHREAGELISFTTDLPEPDYTVEVDNVEFRPEELDIDVGETVEWVWLANGHNIVERDIPEESDWTGTEGFDRYDEGHSHQHTFEVEGVYTYFCAPHFQWGMEGTLLVGDVDVEDEPTDVIEGEAVVTAGPGGDTSFSPDEIAVSTGTTVRWEFESVGHNVKPDEIPPESDWSGTPGGDFDTVPEGDIHEHTFTVPGTYEYYCGPHRQFGMEGVIEVVD